MNNKIMQRLLVILLYQLFIFYSISGQNVFNNVYEIPSYPTIRNVITVDSGYIIAGGHLNPNTSVLIGYVDLQGNFVSYKSYCDSLFNWYHGLEGSLIKTSDGGYALAGSKTIGGLLFKFDHNLDTLWKKEYIFPTQTLFYGCAETESGYALVGLQTENNGQFDQMILVKTDNEGNYLWHKLFGGIYEDAGFKIIKTFDGGFLLGGSSNSFNPQVEPGDAGDWYLVKTDSLGNMQWQKHFGNPDWDDGRVVSMIQTQDSCFVLTGSYAVDYSLVDQNEIMRSRIMKISSNGNIIWDRLYESEDFLSAFWMIKENSQKELIVNGGYGYYSSIDKLYKMNEDGNIVWMREYLPSLQTDEKCGFEALDITQDDGIVLAGWGWGFISGEFQQAWIVKTDNLGCDGFLSCQDTALAMHVTPAEITITQGEGFTINTFIDNGIGPVHVSYSTGAEHYPVYISCPEATDSLTVFPTQDTVIYVTASYGSGTGVTDSTIVHVIIGIEENLLNEGFEIYPNPAKDFIIIEYSHLNFVSENIEIISSQEIVVKTIATNHLIGKTKIPVNDLSSGVYYVKIRNIIRKLVVIK